LLQPGKAVLNKQPKRLQKVKAQKQQEDDDVTSEESDAELLVSIAIISLLMSS